MGTRDSRLANIAKTFPSSLEETHLVIWALMGAEKMKRRRPARVEARKASSDLGHSFYHM